LRRGDEEIDLLEDEEVDGGPDGADEAPDGKAEDAAVEAAEDQGAEAPAEDQAPAPDDAEAPPEGGAVAGKKKGSKKKGSKKAAKPKAPKEPREPKAPKEAVDLGPLKKAAVEAEKAYRHAVEAAAEARAEADKREAAAKAAFVEATRPYKEACRKAGEKAEVGRVRSENLAPQVRFLLEKVSGGIRVQIRGREKETDRVLKTSDLKENVWKTGEAYCEEFIGKKSDIGNKSAGLSLRLRKIAGLA